jgi:basic amino acid/polyamine antiporter, APA family
MTSPSNQPPSDPALRRVLTLWPLMLYGLGVIIGAGVYVAIGAVIERSGGAAPASFLIAGIAAALTGLCYAELAARFPEAAGAASYVRHAFGTKHLGLIVGLGTAASIAVAAASIAHGAVSYLTVLVPLPPALLSAGLVLSFTALALVGVRTSVGLAAVIGALEVGGLVLATIVGLGTAPDFNPRLLLPRGADALQGVVAGAFIAFFAFVGFETLAIWPRR